MLPNLLTIFLGSAFQLKPVLTNLCFHPLALAGEFSIFLFASHRILLFRDLLKKMLLFDSIKEDSQIRAFLCLEGTLSLALEFIAQSSMPYSGNDR